MFLSFFAELKQPAFSLPVWGWLIIGSAYFLMCLAILYNLLTAKASSHRNIAIMLVITMMTANAVWNYLFFGLQSFYYSFIGILVFLPIAFALFFSLWKFQKKSALILFPYLIWLVYDFFWIWNLWKINSL